MASNFRGDAVFKNLGIPPLNYVPRPRAPPRLIRPPSPFTMERPQPIVPDVSLIIDSAATSFHSYSEKTFDDDNCSALAAKPKFISPPNAAVNQIESENTPITNFVNYFPTPSPNIRNSNNARMMSQPDSHAQSRNDSGNGGSPDETSVSENLHTDGNHISSNKSDQTLLNHPEGYESLKEDIAAVMRVVNSQSASIHQISCQLQKMIAFQDKLLVHMTHNNKRPSASTSVQTDNAHEYKSRQSPESRRRNYVEEMPKKGQNLEKTGGSIQGTRPNVSPEGIPSQNNSSSKRSSPSMRQELLKSKIGISTVVQQPEDKKTGGEDLSMVLRNLQISNVQHPSTYSDTSMKSIECPPFADETLQNETSSIGPSVSATGSDVEDDAAAETVFPSVTYYNNLLSTVNRVLDRDQQQKLPPEFKRTASSAEVNRGEGRSSSVSRRSSGRSNKNSPPISSRAFSPATVSYSSDSSSGSLSGENIGRNDDYKENCMPRVATTGDAKSLVNKFLEQQKGFSGNPDENDDYAVESTKKYLQSIGVQFDYPGTNPQSTPPLSSQKQNYMIQQNVYNSIYIPTVNCVPVISESLDSNSGLMDNLARKYIPSAERNDYKMATGRQNEPGAHAETTVYGMTPGNLSFATKEYLKRHGLVGQIDPGSSVVSSQSRAPPIPSSASPDKVLDMTAIRNQPKLL